MKLKIMSYNVLHCENYITKKIDFDAFEAALNEHTMAVIVNSPNNPCGAVYSEETIKKLASVFLCTDA